jgi:hypothetical protein
MYTCTTGEFPEFPEVADISDDVDTGASLKPTLTTQNGLFGGRSA